MPFLWRGHRGRDGGRAGRNERADIAVVVSNAQYTKSARQVPNTTGVVLLHHDELFVQFLAIAAFGEGARTDPERNGADRAHQQPLSGAGIVR